ncbi:MAG: hypothetical protein C0173_03550 [Desulfurella sp.]|nr:MAG: hypothetical protein C0173_03550 [Desulfurella sp.]
MPFRILILLALLWLINKRTAELIQLKSKQARCKFKNGLQITDFSVFNQPFALFLPYCFFAQSTKQKNNALTV